ncbi:MAG: uracil-DNA glycosylase [Candidatus Magasanikbacteria bacterium]|nr:uracil-DNA glycosylase [Candidatus Magasanikbacteria bacterium]MCA9391020.1 uracil-DNA glycosylase [Candidatus Magasanikbacteria bacterium]USN52616.1 MAG: uracil-DNA glycosylase [Candidatus Nomurabacteria bacterium]
MNSANVTIEASWKKALDAEFGQGYFSTLAEFVKNEYKTTKVYPAPAQIFRAFDECPFDQVKVVIIGQDPYHGPGQAHGLCFSVGKSIAIPPSLKNIFKEIADDIGTPLTQDGDLSRWAKQGVFLLNATLTVREGQAGSHQGKGWEKFTDAAIKVISDQREGIVFLLWGRYAQQKESLIDTSKHFVLKTVHPSPLSAYAGWFGCKHFSKANEYLIAKGKQPIQW